MDNQRDTEAQMLSSPEIRQSLVNTAVEFLNMNKIQTQPEEKKRQFLIKKGLSPEEIEVAFKKSNILPKNISNGFFDVEAQNYIHQRQLVPLPPPFSVPYRTPRTIWTVIRDSFNMFMYISGFVVIFNYLYKFYIYPFLTGKKQKSKEVVLLEVQTSLMEVLKHLESTIDKINNNVLLQNEKITEKESRRSLESSYIDDIKTELSTIKSLLINKKSFPPPPSLSHAIPEWQKRSTHLKESKKNEEPKQNEKNEEPKMNEKYEEPKQNEKNEEPKKNEMNGEPRETEKNEEPKEKKKSEELKDNHSNLV